ncbi:hypothetical protein HT136_06895 [Novosphingobium profundi]|uniref:hypothetical protein n=1 Tax=Novosphingobium profundi TaxID=1774954 RepID=UPI001BD94C72|nr:hypothetical protein [Novosphingobium profundi]MBT0668093.1 hypothetical protein [Novosphingobium profundi]
MLAEVAIESAQNSALRRSIEDMIRGRRAREAADMLRDLLAPLCSGQAPLPANFLDVDAGSISFVGWNMLADAIWKLDQCGEPVSAISLELDAHRIGEHDGEPVLATRFYFDTAWPFSECSFEELREGFNDFGSAWHNEHADADDDIVGIDGLGAMAEALARLAKTNARAEDTTSTTIQAQFLATLYIGVLFHLAVDDMARRTGLPRPLALLAESVSPHAGLSAPVMAAGEVPAARSERPAMSHAPEIEDATAASEAQADFATDASGATTDHTETVSALLAPQDEEHEHREDESKAWHLPPPGIHTTGTQLRRRFVTEESIAELQEMRPKGLFARLFRRR